MCTYDPTVHTPVIMNINAQNTTSALAGVSVSVIGGRWLSGNPLSGINGCTCYSLMSSQGHGQQFSLQFADLAFVRKILVTDGLCGCILSLASRPSMHLSFYVL